MSHRKPVVSVILPVYNSQDFVAQTIDSILSQTYRNFELIIVDDASTDPTYSILRQYAKKDHRIRLIRNKINLGVSLTSNIAISQARGKYLARIDSDDICYPSRLEKQLAFLKTNSEVIALGGQCTLIDEQSNLIGSKNFPLAGNLQDMLFWAVPIQQPAMMINLSKLPKNFTWYEANKTSAEEVDLIFKLSRYGQLANLDQYILYYRIRPNSLSHINPKSTFFLTLQSRLAAIRQNIYPTPLSALACLFQIIIISLLPNQLIYKVWYAVRSIKNFNQSELAKLD